MLKKMSWTSTRSRRRPRLQPRKTSSAPKSVVPKKDGWNALGVAVKALSS